MYFIVIDLSSYLLFFSGKPLPSLCIVLFRYFVFLMFEASSAWEATYIFNLCSFIFSDTLSDFVVSFVVLSLIISFTSIQFVLFLYLLPHFLADVILFKEFLDMCCLLFFFYWGFIGPNCNQVLLASRICLKVLG